MAAVTHATIPQASIDAAMGVLLGTATGDALGVPVEFRSREALSADPVAGMRGYGTHHQPPGTWSDDTSMTLSLAESLATAGIDYHDQARRFIAWARERVWTPHGEVFDIGGATLAAIGRLAEGVDPVDAGGTGEWDCGNGSLMRAAPLGVYLAYALRQHRREAAKYASRLTHAHPRCQLACVALMEVVASLTRGEALEAAMLDAFDTDFERHIDKFYPSEQETFAPMLAAGWVSGLKNTPAESVSSGGYVLDTLVASLWCAARAETYADGVLAAVNLGGDTDTTGAVTGALLGIRFGPAAIPTEWIESLSRVDDIQQLAGRFAAACSARWSRDRLAPDAAAN